MCGEVNPEVLGSTGHVGSWVNSLTGLMSEFELLCSVLVGDTMQGQGLMGWHQRDMVELEEGLG